LTFAIVVSTVVSLTITPMICAHYIKEATSDRATLFDRLVEGTLSRIVSFYEWTLRAVLGFPMLTLLVFFATIALTVTLYIKTPKGYFPVDDSGIIVAASQASSDTSFQSMTGFQQQLADVIEADTAVAGIGSILGSMTANRGLFFISLKPPHEREGLTTQLVIDRLRKKLEIMPGVRLYMFPIQDIRAGGRQSNSDYQYTVSSVDIDLMKKWAPIVAKRMESIEGITDISSDRDAAGLQLTLTIDRNAAAKLGVRVQDIDDALNNAFAQRQISIVYTQRNQYMVVLEIDPKFQNDPSSLERIFVASANDAQVPLSTVVRYDRGLASLAINHTQSLPSTTISFNLLPDVPLEVATSNIQRAVDELHMPEGIRGDFDGNAGDFNKTSGNMPLLILGALVAMYIVLGVLYESLAHPLTIISTLPSAGLGALLALQITNTPLTIIAFVGIILLIGIVKKNGIMIVDFALDAERHRGLSSADAIFEACSARFRPILMTTMAALFAGIPLVIATGPGTELRRPLGITIIGGLFVSQILTLYTTPVIYLLIDRLRRRKVSAPYNPRLV
jgi:multidrug efflux pump